MKYTFKIAGAPPGKDTVELDIGPKDTILDIKYKLIKKANLKILPQNLKFIIQTEDTQEKSHSKTP
ncbi:MAG: hypothetical protein LUQ65_04730 [Candidatus Helarchaeota archaeon]|nr:hypothetical protein [Candidatus Helarchaeota archaeon]